MEVKSAPAREPVVAGAGARALEIQARARRFAEEILMPLEQEAERRGGRLEQETIEAVRREAIAAGLAGGLHARERGGQGWTRLEWVLVEEQYGRTTNAIHWHVPNAYNVWAQASDEQVERYLRRTESGFRLNAEKWFVTSGDHADVIVVMANLLDGGHRLPTLFVVDRSRDGIEVVENPDFTHSYPDGHPTIRFNDVELGPEDVIGEVGGGEELQRSWFTEERLAIAARCCGAMWRLLDETVAWTTGREQGGARVYDHQGVSFPLADSAADAAAGRVMTLAVAELADSGADPKLVHHKASMAKLFTSEAAWRCADRCVQAFGGRGYLRSNVAERLLRELRVDRIWEGTSEIQRLIVARGLERRGVEAILH
jgi:acyl-CoA dehydrogenase